MGKKIEDMSEEELTSKSGKAYDKAMPEADTTTGKLKSQSIMDSIKKYNPEGYENIRASERKTQQAGDAAISEYKKGNYGSAAKEGIKGLGGAANTLMMVGPREAGKAVANRIKDGEKMASGGRVKTSSASSRADGCCVKGKTRGKMV
jgi:hypothetical protein